MSKRTIYTGADAARLTFADASGEAGASIATLKGYAITFGTLSSDRGGYVVRLQPGSQRFTDNVHAIYHHEFRDVLGDTASGTLRLLPPDDYGVPVEIDLPNTSLGRDVLELVRTGRVRGMSFAMTTTPEANEVVENGLNILDVSSFSCDEVTITPIPAFTSTSIAVKPGDSGDRQELSADNKNVDVKQERKAERQKLNQLRLALYRL